MRRAARATILALGAAAALVTGPARAAQADDVAVAQARVHALQALVASTTRELTAGTARWEADQAHLSQVRLALRNTDRHISEAQAAVDAAQQQVGQIARQLYIDPMPTAALLVQPSGHFVEALRGQAMLEHVAGSRSQTVARAETARHRLRGEQAQAKALEDQAEQLVDRSAAAMKKLQALAQRTGDQLAAAQSALQAAEARRAAAAAAARAAAARAARTRVVVTGGPACSGKAVQGQQNGQLDPASLCPLWRAPGESLRADAAAAFNKLSQYHAATVGSPLCVTDSYRSYSDQVRLYHDKPGLAAVPGTSNHGWGQAVDLCGGVENSSSPAYDWMMANAGRFGWRHPDWARPGGSRPEPWHWEYGTSY